VRRGWVAGLTIFAVLAVLLAGCGNKSQTASSAAEAVPVSLAEAKMGRLSRGDILAGKVVAAAEVNLVPKMTGKVAEVPVDVGDRVRAGQVVLRLDAPELEAAVRQAEAALALAESNRRQAQLDYDVAAANYERAKVLLEHQALSEAEFQAKYELPYKAAKERVENLAPAQVRQAEAALALARANLANSIVNSPIAGVVTARNVDPGELAAPTMPVLTVADIDRVVVEAGASEQQVNKLKKGQKVRVFISAVRAEPFEGVISSISPAADVRTKMYTVKVEIPNPGHLIKPGMFAEVDLGVAGEAVLVPRDAVVTRDNTTAVFVVVGNKAVLRKVETGPSDGRNIAVLSGLKPGEKVVVAGQELLEHGTKVTVAGAGS